MKPWILIPVTLASVGLIASGALRRREGTGIRAGEDDRSTESALAGEIDALKEEVARLKRKSEATRVYLVAPGADPSEPPVAPEQEETQSAEQKAEEMLQAAAANLDRRLASEPADLGWSRETVRQIEEAIATNARGTRVLAAACASTLCRVEVDHDTAEAQLGLGEALAEVEPFRAGVFYSYDEAAVPPTTTLYVVRDGHDFREGSGSL